MKKRGKENGEPPTFAQAGGSVNTDMDCQSHYSTITRKVGGKPTGSLWVIDGKRYIGVIYTELQRTFCRYVKGSLHLLRSLDAWGLPCDLLDWLLLKCVASVVMYDSEENKSYQVARYTFDDAGIRKDLGAGPQVFLPRLLWAQSPGEPKW